MYGTDVEKGVHAQLNVEILLLIIWHNTDTTNFWGQILDQIP